VRVLLGQIRYNSGWSKDSRGLPKKKRRRESQAAFRPDTPSSPILRVSRDNAFQFISLAPAKIDMAQIANKVGVVTSFGSGRAKRRAKENNESRERAYFLSLPHSAP